MTSERAFPVRVPHRGEMMIDPSRFFIFVSSNGFETTRDFANRSSIIRIRKRPQSASFRAYPEGDLLTHVRALQPYYLGCVFAVVRAWLAEGKPQTQESRHDFRDWACTLDWIVQNLLKAAPLMDGHGDARERVSDPGKGFIRTMTALIEAQGRLGQELTASELYALAEEKNVVIPCLNLWNEETNRRRIVIEDYHIAGGTKEVWRHQYAGHKALKCYRCSQTSKQCRP